MASTIAAVTTGGGGVVTTADSSGNLSLLSGATTVVAVTSAGVAVTGTLAATGAVTASTTLAVTGASTFTGTGKFATTIGVGNATPAASGSGITFPATQSVSSDANTLDDYEEGTFTPTLSSFGGTGLAATGYYTKIGRVVSWLVNITGTSVTSTANTSSFTMPFTAPSLQGMGTCVAVNTSTVSYGVGVAGSTTSMQPPTWAATSSIYITGVMTTP
jgi:hypothetical protein